MLHTTPATGVAWHSGMALRILVPSGSTGGRLAICEISAPASTQTGVHRHEHEDEVVSVVEGAVDVWLGGERTTVAAGGSVLLPRRIPHRLAVGAEAPARFLMAFLPGGVEQALLAASAADPAIAPDPDDVAALLAGAGVSVFGWQTDRGAATDRQAPPNPAAASWGGEGETVGRT